jgi:hypothetical protein
MSNTEMMDETEYHQTVLLVIKMIEMDAASNVQKPFYRRSNSLIREGGNLWQD